MTPSRILVVVLIAQIANLAKGLCPNLFTELNGHCYFFSESLPLAKEFDEARRFCAKFNSDTAIFDLLVLDGDINKYHLIKNEMARQGYFGAVIGAQDLGLSTIQWAWITGTTLSLDSSLWDCKAPSNTSNNVGMLVYNKEYTSAGCLHRLRLHDTIPEKENYFICEGSMVPPTYVDKKILPMLAA